MYYTRLPKFDNKKLKLQNIYRYNEYEDIITNSFVALTKLDVGENAPYPTWCRMIALGEIGVCEDGTIGDIVRSGEIDINGEMKDIDYVLGLDGKEHKGKCLPLYMLPSKTPFTTFSRFAEQLSQVDISQKALVKATRTKDVIIADTESEKDQIDKVYADLENGITKTIIKDSDIFRQDTVGEQKRISLNNPTMFQSMEYLSSYHSELCRRLYGLFGFSMQGKDKQAQVNSDELEDREQPSLIYIRLIIDTVSECLEKINKEFGFNWSIKPSKIIEKMLNEVEKNETENVENGDKGVKEDEN